MICQALLEIGNAWNAAICNGAGMILHLPGRKAVRTPYMNTNRGARCWSNGLRRNSWRDNGNSHRPVSGNSAGPNVVLKTNHSNTPLVIQYPPYPVWLEHASVEAPVALRI